MTLTLRIDNLDSLPDGGPLTYVSEGRSFEIGRDNTMDWSLPDPNRFVSSRHLEIRYDQGRYWMNDVSTNGTFVNGGSMRVKSPYLLEQGDRLQIGHYLVVVELAEPARAAPPRPAARAPAADPGSSPSPFADFSDIGMPAAPAPGRPAAPSGGGGDIWSLGGGGASVPDPGFDPTPRQARRGDFSDQHIAIPPAAPEPPPQPQAPPQMPSQRAPATADAGASPFGPMPGAAQRPQVPAEPAPPSPAELAPAPPVGDAEALFLRALCEGAGLRPEVLAMADPAATGREIGRTLRIVAEDLAGLLKARAATKQSVKSGSRTMIGSTDNNPLKFVPTAEEALEVMYGTARPGFLRGAAAVKSALDDIKRHQYGVHAAIQPALAQLLEELSPEAIEAKIGASMLSSKKARAWELFVERWDAMTTPYENGMLDVFLAYFSDAYDAATRKS